MARLGSRDPVVPPLSSDKILKTIDHVIPKVGGATFEPGDLNNMEIK